MSSGDARADGLREPSQRVALRVAIGAGASRILLASDVALLVLTIANDHGPVRFVLGLVVGLVVPGWSVVGVIGVRDAALAIGLTLASSLAMIMLSAQVLITVKLWHPVAFEEFVCLACLPSLVWLSRRHGSRGRDRT